MSEPLSIFYCSDGKEWADYIQEKLSAEEYNIQTILKDFETADTKIDTDVNVFLMSPVSIQLDKWDLMNYSESATSLAVLTGISFDDWSSAIQTYNMESLYEWCYYELKPEEESVRQLLILIVSLYESKYEYENISTEPKNDPNAEIVVPIHVPDKRKKSISDLDNPEETETKETEMGEIKTEDKIYQHPPKARPVNTVRYVFRQGGNVYILLEDTNDGLVQVKFHEDGTIVNAACVSDKTTVYSFQHTGTERETFDVTLDGIEVGYGALEKDETQERTQSTISEKKYAFIQNVRDSTFSTSSVSSSVSSHSSNSNQPPPCGNRPVNYTNIPQYSLQSPETSEVKFTLPSSSPLTRNSGFEDQSYGTRSDRYSPTRTLSNVSASTGSSAVSSKLDQIHRLLEEVTDPVSVLCQSLQAENVKQLDEKMTVLLESTEALKHLSFKTSLDALPDKCDAVCPTLLHFGAQFDLHRFCNFLLDNPITRNAAVKKNRDGFYPHDVARRECHEELAKVLEEANGRLRSGKKKSHDSGISQCTTPTHDSLYMDMSYFNSHPPTQHPGSLKSRRAEEVGIRNTRHYSQEEANSFPFNQPCQQARRIDAHVTLHKSHVPPGIDGSIVSEEEDYEVPINPIKEDVRGSVTSSESLNKESSDLHLKLGSGIYLADDDDDNKTPVANVSREQHFDDASSRDSSAEGGFSQRESNGIENPGLTPRSRKVSEEFRTNKKDLASVFGEDPTYRSTPSDVAPQPTKKSMLNKIFGQKKDKSRTVSEPRIRAEEMMVIHGQPHAGLKTQVFRRDLIEDDPSSAQFRSRLSTYPGPGQPLVRPNLSHLKKKLKSERDFSSIPDLSAAEEAALAPPVPCSMLHVGTHSAPSSPFQRSKQQHYVKRTQQPGPGTSDISSYVVPHSPKEKEVTKRERNKKADKKAKNKKKIQHMITKAQRRTSMRLYHASTEPVDSPPPLPPRPTPKLTQLGAF